MNGRAGCDTIAYTSAAWSVTTSRHTPRSVSQARIVLSHEPDKSKCLFSAGVRRALCNKHNGGVRG